MIFYFRIFSKSCGHKKVPSEGAENMKRILRPLFTDEFTPEEPAQIVWEYEIYPDWNYDPYPDWFE